MIREILTLSSGDAPLQYYIQFEKERDRFAFQPTFKNKGAPAFVIYVRDQELIAEGLGDPQLEAQAKEKVRDILSDLLFDQF